MREDESLCEECGRRRATVHLTDFVDGQPVQRNLCERCYAEKEGGQTLPSALVFARLLAAVAPELGEAGAVHCPECGISYLELHQTMRAGCQRDYEVFEKALDQLLERLHGSTVHCGKVPPDASEEAVVQTRIRSLRRQQEKAVAEENYELAAELRDRLKELEKYERRRPEG